MSETSTDRPAAGHVGTPGGTQEAAGGTPTPPEGEASPTQTDDVNLRAALEATRKEAASYRTRLKALEEAEEKRKAQSLSEEEKRQKAFEEAQKAAKDANAELQSARLQRAVEKAARKAGIVDEEAAFLLLPTGALELDEEGSPKNIDTLLKGLIEARPWLLGSGAPSPTGGSSAAPSRARGATLTREDIQKMSTQEINARWEEVQKALSS